MRAINKLLKVIMLGLGHSFHSDARMYDIAHLSVCRSPLCTVILLKIWHSRRQLIVYRLDIFIFLVRVVVRFRSICPCRNSGNLFHWPLFTFMHDCLYNNRVCSLNVVSLRARLRRLLFCGLAELTEVSIALRE